MRMRARSKVRADLRPRVRSRWRSSRSSDVRVTTYRFAGMAASYRAYLVVDREPPARQTDCVKPVVAVAEGRDARAAHAVVAVCAEQCANQRPGCPIE